MINSLSGKIISKKEKYIVLDISGIGFKIFLAKENLKKIPKEGENFKAFSYLDVGEKSLNLYGFLDEKELEFFELVKAIQGVGPKAALEISSLGPIEEIKKAILAGNEKLFERISGIGRKKAQKIILELTGKIKELEKKTILEDDALKALINLGFPKQRAKQALLKIPSEVKDTQDRIKEALRILAK